MKFVHLPADRESSATAAAISAPRARKGDYLRRIGGGLARHQRVIRTVQWLMISAYIVLVTVPAFLPLPDRTAHIWSSLTLFAQFVFWGIWWPFVLLSMVLVGRVWCGLLCPEGALSEAASRRGKGWAVPRWIKWPGWPFAAFALTTVYGQLVSVYQYPGPVLLVLGGSTVAAIVVGALYGRNKRVWCRYLCPVNGVFGLLSKLAPLHFRVDQDAWKRSGKPVGAVSLNCAPLVPIRTMRGATACHMCGRCSGFRDAVVLSARSPNHEIVHVVGTEIRPWETRLIIFGLMGVAVGAFHWSASPWFIDVKQTVAEWLVDHGMVFLLEPRLPWWMLTNYPDQNDALAPLDGAVLVFYVAVTALVIGGGVSACLAVANRLLGPWSRARFHHLAQGLIPIAACGVFLGLSALTVTMLRAEGLTLGFVGMLRAVLLAGAAGWSLVLCWRIAEVHGAPIGLRCAALVPMAGAVALGVASWVVLFWVW